MSNEMAINKSALQMVAGRLNLDPEECKKMLKATAFKADREVTDAEFMALMVVANTYKLNPITKEIYAYPKKGGGIEPIVSTDGWTNIITKHESYKSHAFRYSEKMVTMKGAKPCPEWCEIDIEKKDGSHVIVREYLDEVFRELNYVNPWQTHTKRMLRHKTKIQGGREAFGFSGICDEDEAERIIEATENVGMIEMPRSTKEAVTVQATPEPTEERVPDEEPKEPEQRPLPPGYRLIKVKYNGICKGCGQETKEGQEVAYSKEKGVYHPDCVS